MEHFWIVLYRGSNGIWRPNPNGVHTSRRLAENQVEIEKLQGSPLDWAIVDGPITNPFEMAETEKALDSQYPEGSFSNNVAPGQP